MIRSDNKWLELIANSGEPLTKTMTLAGGTTNDPGDFDGTGNPATLFTVTGVVAMKLFAVCTTALVGASATIEVGVTGGTATLIAQTTAANIIAKEIWHDATPDARVELSSIATEKIVTDNVIQTIATANVTAGVLRYFCVWRPISDDGRVTVA